MKKDVRELVDARLTKADEAFYLAQLAINEKYWTSAANRLYYTCFYLITALFVSHNIRTHTHTGVKTIFGLKFIKEGLIEAKWGRFFNNLFDTRQEGDYGDFIVLTSEDLLPLMKEVEEFRSVINKLINDDL